MHGFFFKYLKTHAYIAVVIESNAQNKWKHWIVSAVSSPEKRGKKVVPYRNFLVTIVKKKNNWRKKPRYHSPTTTSRNKPTDWEQKKTVPVRTLNAIRSKIIETFDSGFVPIGQYFLRPVTDWNFVFTTLRLMSH